MDKWHVYLYGIMWDGADSSDELPDNLRCTVNAADRPLAIQCALQVASEEFEAGIQGTEQIEATLV